jgi:hypothetical protein
VSDPREVDDIVPAEFEPYSDEALDAALDPGPEVAVALARLAVASDELDAALAAHADDSPEVAEADAGYTAAAAALELARRRASAPST